MQQLHRAASAFLLLCALSPAQSFVNFESGPVHPVRVSQDGTRLFVCDTVGSRLSVFDLRNPSAPVLLREIPVGLDPVSVQPRTNDEVWVANLMSDTVSIVSVEQGCVIATLAVKDEPSDIAFAGGFAFVTTATTDDVKVFDVTTRALVGTVPVFGKDPRALAVSNDGSKVYAVVQRSGNGTTVLDQSVSPLPPPPTNTSLPAAPRQGIIVRATDPAWTAQIPFSMPDNDVAEIDVATRTVTRYFRAVGTTNAGIAVHPTSGELWVANTDARNLVRFEPNLRGHVIDSRLTRITTGAVPVVTPFDLNPGINYNTLPNPSALGTALSEPFDVTIDAQAGLIYVAAQGTDRIGVLDLNGTVVGRIEVGNTPGAQIDTHNKRGPRGLALHPTAARLYVQNRLSDTLTVIDTGTQTVLRELKIASYDPMPAAMRTGRKFLYDGKLSGNGTMSCAACHVDGDMDGIAWDLGDPAGTMAAAPSQPFPFSLLPLPAFHPMKGPMTTQTLRGLDNTQPLHWRGDRATFQAFNPAFNGLMGGAQLSTADMDLYAGFATAMAHPPNPNQLLDRGLRTTPANNNETAGKAAFLAAAATLPIIGAVSCSTCHSLPTGTNRVIVSATILNEPQMVKVPQLRNLYRKVGFNRLAGQQKSGFGFTKDGAIDNLTSFIAIPQFNTWPAATKDDIVTFLLTFDSGTAPLVGYQLTMTQANAATTDLTLLTARTAAGDIDLVAKGLLDGRMAGLRYLGGQWLVDRLSEGPYTFAQLQSKAQAGNATLTFMGVPPGSGARLGIDRDGDGTRDGDDGVMTYGTGIAGCSGMPQLDANSEPRIANAGFAIVASRAPANGPGFLLMGTGQGNTQIAGVTVLVDLLGPTSTVFVQSDALGWSTWSIPIPAQPALAGANVFAQIGWLDNCAPIGIATSGGLGLTVRPQ